MRLNGEQRPNLKSFKYVWVNLHKTGWTDEEEIGHRARERERVVGTSWGIWKNIRIVYRSNNKNIWNNSCASSLVGNISCVEPVEVRCLRSIHGVTKYDRLRNERIQQVMCSAGTRGKSGTEHFEMTGTCILCTLVKVKARRDIWMFNQFIYTNIHLLLIFVPSKNVDAERTSVVEMIVSKEGSNKQKKNIISAWKFTHPYINKEIRKHVWSEWRKDLPPIMSVMEGSSCCPYIWVIGETILEECRYWWWKYQQNTHHSFFLQSTYLDFTYFSLYIEE